MSWEIVPNEGNTEDYHLRETPFTEDTIGTICPIRGYATITCRCGETYWKAPECPYCGYPAMQKVRFMSESEKELAEAAGIDYTDEANWDTIERLARVVQNMYSDY